MVFGILLNYLHDTTQVETLSGCIGNTELIGDYFIGVAQLNPKQESVLDSVLLYDKTIKLDHKSYVLRDLKPQARHYARVKELVRSERNLSALVALAKYRKQSDKVLIASFFNNIDTQTDALYAVNEFADPYFYPYVTKVFEQEWKEKYYDYPKWRICYQVLAQYPNAETMKLFKRTMLTSDKTRYEYLCQYLLIAIRKHTSSNVYTS